MDKLIRLAQGRDSSPARVEQFAPPVKRTRMGAFVSAWVAARCRVPLAAYLASRYVHYDRTRPPHHLPELPTLGPDGITPALAQNPVEDPVLRVLDDQAGVDTPSGPSSPAEQIARWIRQDQQAAAAQLVRDLERAEAEEQRVEARVREAVEQLEDLRVAHDTALAEGRLLAAATLARSPEQRGRPRVPRSWAPTLLIGGEVAIVIAEAYSFLPAMLDLSGIVVPDGDVFALPFQVLAPSAALSLVCASAAFVGIGAATSAAIGRGSWGDLGAMRRVYAAVAAAAGLGVLASVAALRHGFVASTSELSGALASAAAGSPPAWPFVVITIALPVLAALAHEYVRAAQGDRRAALEAVRTFDDGERTQSADADRAAERTRHAEEVRTAAIAERDQIRAQLRALNEKAQAAESALRRTHEVRLAFAHAWSRSVVAALGLDRYAYEVVANRGRGSVAALPVAGPSSHAEEEVSGVRARALGGDR